MKYAKNILETIGNTPLVKLNKVLGEDFPALVLAKVETFNPGNSVKDRMALDLLHDIRRNPFYYEGNRTSERAYFPCGR